MILVSTLDIYDQLRRNDTRLDYLVPPNSAMNPVLRCIGRCQLSSSVGVIDISLMNATRFTLQHTYLPGRYTTNIPMIMISTAWYAPLRGGHNLT